MPLTPSEPPEAVYLAAAAYVRDSTLPEHAFPPLRDVEREILELVAPHQVFTLGLDAVLGQGMQEAQPTGWRFLVGDGRRILASAEVAAGPDQSPSLNYGSYVNATAEAIDWIEELPDIAAGSFELRLLKVPALYVAAAWLVDDRSLVVPLAPAPAYLDAGHSYPEQEFIAMLRARAEAVASQDDGLSGG